MRPGSGAADADAGPWTPSRSSRTPASLVTRPEADTSTRPSRAPRVRPSRLWPRAVREMTARWTWTWTVRPSAGPWRASPSWRSPSGAAQGVWPASVRMWGFGAGAPGADGGPSGPAAAGAPGPAAAGAPGPAEAGATPMLRPSTSTTRTAPRDGRRAVGEHSNFMLLHEPRYELRVLTAPGPAPGGPRAAPGSRRNGRAPAPPRW